MKKPNYIEARIGNGEILRHAQMLHDDGDIDAIIVRGGLDRLTAEQQVLLATSITDNCYRRPSDVTRRMTQSLLGLIIADIDELTAFYTETAQGVMFDFEREPTDKVLGVDEIRTSGLGSHAHIDLPSGIGFADGFERIRAVSSLSVGAGTNSARFLSTRLPSFNRPGDATHRFMSDYLETGLVEELENSGNIHRDGWAITQNPGDIVIFPQFDRPAVHQVVSQPGRTAVVYSTWITSRYAALAEGVNPKVEQVDYSEVTFTHHTEWTR